MLVYGDPAREVWPSEVLAASALEGLVPEEAARLRRAAARYATLLRGTYFA